jgi:hypothetical protein
VKRNVTVALEEEVARWARVEAARRDVSVSQLLANLLRTSMERTEGYDDAMREFLGRRSSALKPAGTGYPDREDLHDRAGLR